MYSYETNGRGNTSATDAKLLERKSQFINLPAVTPEDNGKVLGVDKGKWQPVNGGGWPADLPKPSVGGYGYTESGEQTVITWDGDTEGRDSFMLNFGLGEMPYYKVSEKSDNYTDSALVLIANIPEIEAVKSDGDGAFMYFDGENVLVVVADGGDFSLYNGAITGNAPSAGVYFMTDTQEGLVVSSLTYGTPDTIHKIDEKYLPASGGVMVVTLQTTDGETATADKSVEELFAASAESCVVAKVMFGDMMLGAFPLYMAATSEGFPVLGFGATGRDEEGRHSVLKASVCGAVDDSGDSWTLNIF